LPPEPATPAGRLKYSRIPYAPLSRKLSFFLHGEAKTVYPRPRKSTVMLITCKK
jgi:hypothetical protein